MNKLNLYYTTLVIVLAIQFIASVATKSIVVQETAATTQQQRQLAQLETKEALLTGQLAEQTSVLSLATEPTATGFIALAKPTPLTAIQLVASR